MKLFERILTASLLCVAMFCSGCSGFHDADTRVPPAVTMTVPDTPAARSATAAAIRALPGVRGVASTYHEPARIMNIWVQYERVPDRWPIVEALGLATESAVRNFTATHRATVHIMLIDYRPGETP